MEVVEVKDAEDNLIEEEFEKLDKELKNTKGDQWLSREHYILLHILNVIVCFLALPDV